MGSAVRFRQNFSAFVAVAPPGQLDLVSQFNKLLTVALSPICAAPSSLWWYWLIYTAVLAVASFFMLRKRRAEAAQSGFAYKAPYYVIKLFVSFAAGLLTAIVSALFYASLIAFNKRIVRTSGLQTAAIELDVAFIVVLIYVLLTSGLPHLHKADLPYIAAIGLINTGLAYLLYFSGLQKLSGQSVALISYIDPVSALVFSALLLHEAMTPVQLLGAVLIIGGAMFGELRRK